MNRSIALFVALAVLVAHSFAIHNDGSGSLAPPYDWAFVAYRLGRNLVYEGALEWMPGVPGFDSHPSLLWMLVCAAGERVSIGLNPFCQGLGMAATVMTLVIASRFHPDRIASLIAPLLLAISGGMAAAAVSGTETAALTFFATMAFLAFERGWSWPLGVALLFAGLARPEGWFLAVVLGCFRAVQLLLAPADERRTSAARALAPFAVPAAGLFLVALLRLAATGQFFSTWTTYLARVDGARITDGFGYLRDFVSCTGSPLLLVYSIWYLVRGRLSATGTRALLVFALWCGLAVWRGGGGPIFGETLVPVLPIGLIAAQEGMIAALNSTRSWVRGLAWTSFLFAVAGSALASRSPGDLGPLPFARWQTEWTESHSTPRYGYEDRLGRAGLREEIAKTAYLRATGIFLRDELNPSHSVLTAWPGSIGYLSRLRVFDLLGRVMPPAGEERRLPWYGAQRVDVAAQLRREPDYFVPFNELPPRAPAPSDMVSSWLRELDSRADEPGRRDALAAELAKYELLAVPIDVGGAGLPNSLRSSAYLLRRRALALAPRLEIEVDEEGFTVLLRHEGHQQLAELRVRATTERGQVWYLDPTGEFRENRPLYARSHLLLYPTGERAIQLIRAPFPRSPRFVEIDAVMCNPESQATHEFAFASSETRIELR